MDTVLLTFYQLIIFVTSFDPDQAPGPTIGQALPGSKLFDTVMVLWKEFFLIGHSEKKHQDDKIHEKSTSMQRV